MRKGNKSMADFFLSGASKLQWIAFYPFADLYLTSSNLSGSEFIIDAGGNRYRVAKSSSFRNNLQVYRSRVEEGGREGRVLRFSGLKCSHKKTIINSINTCRAFGPSQGV